MTATLRRGVLLMATMLVTLLLGSIPANADDGGLHSDYAGVQAALAAHADLADAAEALAKGLADGVWAGPDTLGEKGKKAFDAARKAIKKIQDVDPDHDAIAALIAILSSLVDGEMIAAPSGSDLSKATEKLGKADQKLAEGKPEKAAKELGKAWKEARKAAEKYSAPTLLTLASGASGGSYSEYTVEFIHVSGDMSFIVSGTNAAGTQGYTGKGNEGFIFSPQFSANDSFHGADLMWNGMQGMQLHVSCSDAFPGGYGAKSDPDIFSEWLVNKITITKVKDGVVDKTCNLNGVGIDIPPPGNE